MNLLFMVSLATGRSHKKPPRWNYCQLREAQEEENSKDEEGFMAIYNSEALYRQCTRIRSNAGCEVNEKRGPSTDVYTLYQLLKSIVLVIESDIIATIVCKYQQSCTILLGWAMISNYTSRNSDV